MEYIRYIDTVDGLRILLSNFVSDTYKTYDMESLVYVGAELMELLRNHDNLLEFEGGNRIEITGETSSRVEFSYLENEERHGFSISGILPTVLYLGFVTIASAPGYGYIEVGNDRGGEYLQANNNAFFADWFDHIDIQGKEDDDPYDEGGLSGVGGGSGNFDNSSDSIDIPGLPTLSAVSTGFVTLYNPTIAQLQNLSAYMWSGLFDIETYRKIFADPMDTILGLSLLPVDVPNGGLKDVKVGNISTGISMIQAASQYVRVECGSVSLNEYWGSYLDYDPYTKVSIYLPYVGIRPLSTDDVMGTDIRVAYNVDILSGACTAFVKCGPAVMYTFIGQCSVSIPITSSNWESAIQGALNIAGSIGSMVASGGASAPSALGAIASIASNIMSMKPSIQKSGAMSGMGGQLGLQTPFLIIERPRQAKAENQKGFLGYPAFITYPLNNIEGYTIVNEVHLEGIPATDAEISEIERLLKSGVFM